jgi:TPP-dependent indolepyruvate ferredoxin oxidoreductase alpha subunit
LFNVCFVGRKEVLCMGCGGSCGTCPFQELEEQAKKKAKNKD